MRAFNTNPYLLVLTVFLLVLNFQLEAQQANETQILLLGCRHHFPEDSQENFTQSVAAIVKFKPDLICTEFLPSEDLPIALKLGGKRIKNQQKIFLKKNPLGDKNLDEEISNYYSLIEQNPYNLNPRIRLTPLLYLKYDLANFYFQLFQIFYQINKLGQSEQEDFYRQIEQYLFPKSEFLPIIKDLFQSEYGNIIFPAALALKKKMLYGVDDQSNYKAFHKNGRKSVKKLQKKLKVDVEGLNDFFWHEYDSLDSVSLAQGVNTFFLNSFKHDALVTFGDEGVIEYDDSKYTKRRVELWKSRNQAITQNIIGLAKKYPNKRILVAIGANHRPLLIKYLKQEKDIKIIQALLLNK